MPTILAGLPERKFTSLLGQRIRARRSGLPCRRRARAEERRLEGRSIDAVAVGEAGPGRFVFFMDGAQRTRGPIYIDSPVPIMYGYVSAVIRLRAERRMGRHDHKIRESLYFPHLMLDPAPFRRAGVETVDSGDGEGDLEQHPMMLVERAKKKISDARSNLENKISSKWFAEFDGRDEWLLVDGSLCGGYERYEAPNIVGVIKSHQTQYFQWEEQRKILGLKVGERSGVFVPLGRKRPKVYSWYLRLRPNDGRDMYFGLVRVEAARCERTLDGRRDFPVAAGREEPAEHAGLPLGQDDLPDSRLRAVSEEHRAIARQPGRNDDEALCRLAVCFAKPCRQKRLHFQLYYPGHNVVSILASSFPIRSLQLTADTVQHE